MSVERLTIQQQVQRLQDLGIEMSPDSNAERNIETVNTIGYYKLKEFAMPFNTILNTEDGTKVKFEGITFKQLITRYYQDKNLRINVLHAIESIEVKLQNEVSYVLGKKYGAFGYLSFSNWCNRIDNTRFEIEGEQYRFKKALLKKVKKSQLPDLKYKHNMNVDGFPTVWIMIDALTFGDTVHLLKYMSKNNLTAISNQFNCTPNELMSWLECLNLVRNVCCHNSDLLDYQFITKPIVPQSYINDIYRNKNGKFSNRIAIAIFIIQELMKSVNAKYNFGAIEKSLSKIIGEREDLANSLGFANHKAIKALHVSRRTRKHDHH